MNDPIFNWPNLTYWLVTLVVVGVEAATFGVLWERKEAYRWTMGYATVFFLAIPMVVLGYWDSMTWLGLFFGVGVSGAAKLGVDQWRKSREAQRLRRMGGVNATTTGQR
jgi:hypothetical protein